MINLKCDNRVLTSNAPYTYLISNSPSGSNSLQVANSTDIKVGSLILVGDIGQDTTEMFQVGAIDTSGNVSLLTIYTTGTQTSYAHTESTKVYVIPYDQIQFYWTAATGTIADENPSFNTSNPLGTVTNLNVSDLYTTYTDTTNSTGFGWFVLSNSLTNNQSQNSNPIPYGGFSPNTVAQVFADFDSLLNVKEQKLVTVQDKFSWLNEALAMIKNKLNLTNVEYTVSNEVALPIFAGTSEYQLPDDFADLVYLSNSSSTAGVGGGKQDIPFISVTNIGSFNGWTMSYYLRNRYLGIVPQPDYDTILYYRYRAKASRVTSASDYIDLPDNAFYTLKDWMMYRACMKFSNPQSQSYLQSFTNAVNMYMQAAVLRDSNLDTWGISRYSNT